MNQRVLVAPDMYDKPNRQLGSIILPPDPVSIQYAMPEPYPVDELWCVMQELGNDRGAMPVYLEVTTMGGMTQPTKAWSLELGTIQMDDVDTS